MNTCHCKLRALKVVGANYVRCKRHGLFRWATLTFHTITQFYRQADISKRQRRILFTKG